MQVSDRDRENINLLIGIRNSLGSKQEVDLSDDYIQNLYLDNDRNQDLIRNFITLKIWINKNLSSQVREAYNLNNDADIFDQLKQNNNNCDKIINHLSELLGLVSSPPTSSASASASASASSSSSTEDSSSVNQIKCSSDFPPKPLVDIYDKKNPEITKKLLDIFGNENNNFFIDVPGGGFCGVRSILCGLNKYKLDIQDPLSEVVYQYKLLQKNKSIKIPYEKKEAGGRINQYNIEIEQLDDKKKIDEKISVLKQIYDAKSLLNIDLSTIMKIFTYVYDCNGIILSSTIEGNQCEFYRGKEDPETAIHGVPYETVFSIQAITNGKRTIILINNFHAMLIVPNSEWKSDSKTIAEKWNS